MSRDEEDRPRWGGYRRRLDRMHDESALREEFRKERERERDRERRSRSRSDETDDREEDRESQRRHRSERRERDSERDREREDRRENLSARISTDEEEDYDYEGADDRFDEVERKIREGRYKPKKSDPYTVHLLYQFLKESGDI